ECASARVITLSAANACQAMQRDTYGPRIAVGAADSEALGVVPFGGLQVPLGIGDLAQMRERGAAEVGVLHSLCDSQAFLQYEHGRSVVGLTIGQTPGREQQRAATRIWWRQAR